MKIRPEIKITAAAVIAAVGFLALPEFESKAAVTSASTPQTIETKLPTTIVPMLEADPLTKIQHLRLYFINVLRDFPDGFQADIIRPLTRAKAFRLGILNTNQNAGILFFEYRPVHNFTEKFKAEFGVAENEIRITEGKPSKAQALLASLFDTKGRAIGESENYPDSPYRMSSLIRSLRSYDRNGNRLIPNSAGRR